MSLSAILIVRMMKSNDVFAIEFIWPSKAKSLTCPTHYSIDQNQKKEMKFTLDASKCNRIFLYEMHM